MHKSSKVARELSFMHAADISFDKVLLCAIPLRLDLDNIYIPAVTNTIDPALKLFESATYFRRNMNCTKFQVLPSSNLNFTYFPATSEFSCPHIGLAHGVYLGGNVNDNMHTALNLLPITSPVTIDCEFSRHNIKHFVLSTIQLAGCKGTNCNTVVISTTWLSQHNMEILAKWLFNHRLLFGYGISTDLACLRNAGFICKIQDCKNTPTSLLSDYTLYNWHSKPLLYSWNQKKHFMKLYFTTLSTPFITRELQMFGGNLFQQKGLLEYCVLDVLVLLQIKLASR
jgi:hypothetical protein